MALHNVVTGPWAKQPEGTEPPDNGGMEARVAALEKDVKDVRERVIKIESKLDGFPALFASKSDVSEAKAQIIMWVVGAIFLAQLMPPIIAALSKAAGH